MKIAILSGKGGTGKTTLSVNLFSYLDNVTLIDADVEEPNSHLFLKGDIIKEEGVFKQYPLVDDDLCTYCGKCGDFCNFNAIIPTKKKVLQEAKDLQAAIDKDGCDFQLEAWDWWYYTEKVLASRFELDEEELKAYFKLENVRDGAFAVAEKLYSNLFSILLKLNRL